jgi:hypothetical protein
VDATRAGLLVAFLPAAGSELLGNATNLHFYLTYTCFWALVWELGNTDRSEGS